MRVTREGKIESSLQETRKEGDQRGRPLPNAVIVPLCKKMTSQGRVGTKCVFIMVGDERSGIQNMAFYPVGRYARPSTRVKAIM